MKLQSITNVIWFCYGLQYMANKWGIDLIPTYLNTKTVTAKGFNPTYLILKAVDPKSPDGKTFGYVSMRTTIKCVFSSVMVLSKDDFDMNKPVFYEHIEGIDDSVEGINGFSQRIIAALNVLKNGKL